MKSNSTRTGKRAFVRSTFIFTLSLLCVLMAGILGLNILIINRTQNTNTMSEGQMQLTNIAAEVESSLYQAECIVESIVSQVEQILSDDIDNEAQLDKFIGEMMTYVTEKTDGIGFSVYAAYKGELYIVDFTPDDDYVINDREWHKGAKKQQGGIFITSPYIDANTGKMCFSISKLLSDGDTVIGVDYSMDRIQSFIEEMSDKNGGISMIVNDAGTVIGHSDASGVGNDYTTLPHADIVRKVFSLYGDSFVYDSNGEKYNVFSSKTSYGWYLIVCVDSKAVAAKISNEFAWMIFFIALLAVSIIAYYIYSYVGKIRSERQIASRDEALRDIKNEWERYSFAVMNRNRLAYRSGIEDTESDSHIIELTERMSSMLNDINAGDEYGSDKNNASVSDEYDSDKRYNKSFMLIVGVLLLTSIITIVINTITQLSSIDFRMRDEVKDYYYQTKEWAAENKTLVGTLSQAFTAKPELVENYAECVAYIDDVVSGYDDVSVAYIVNPEWEHTVIMNNGWEPPDENWKVEERQWYKETLDSKNPNGFNISTPYLDEQTGFYCVTLSQIVYDSDGDRIGILGIDYYMDKLISILGRSYTENGYAFLVDMDYNILNHPFEEYQMTTQSTANAGTLAYRSAITSDKSVVIKDYDGKNRLCLIQQEEVSGFSVVLVKDWWYMYGSLMLSDTAFLLLFFICIVIEIVIMSSTNRREEEARLELKAAAEKANAASKAKDDFLANMSHEIRTPMNAVVGMCELILKENDISDTVRDCCYNIRNSGRSLLSIINDILDFSKIESGKMELIEEEFNISSTLDDIINMAVTRKGSKKIEIIVHADPKIPSGLIGDELRIRQVIINIVTNVVKYTPEGAVIISVSYTDTDNGITLRVSVKDTGIGISEENLNKVFNSFQQVDTKKNRAVEGTGLGLAITQRIVSLMGGTVNVISVYGKGSEFILEIPLGVSDRTPFIAVKEPEKIRAAGYIKRNKYALPLISGEYEKLIHELNDGLGVNMTVFDDADVFRSAVQEGGFTHIFSTKTEYLENKEFFDSQSEKTDVVIIRDRDDPIDLPHRVKCIFKPFYAISAAAMFNNERITANFDDSRKDAAFTAPKARVLIVDDNIINIKVASGLMKPYKMQILTADSAEAAISIVKNKDIDLVFMDHMMPVTDGVEATAMIRAMDGEYFSNLPIIALTANAINGVKDMFIEAGMNDFLAKPIELASLDNMLRTWLPESLIEYADDVKKPAPATSEAAETKDSADSPDKIYDPELGLNGIGGDEEGYSEILSIFVRDSEKNSREIDELYGKEDWKNYIIKVHALKSASLLAGSRKLSELAKELEFAGKGENYSLIHEKHGSLIKLYSEVAALCEEHLKKIAPAPSEPVVTALEEADEAAVRGYLNRVIEASGSFDSTEIEAICKDAARFSYNGKPLYEMFSAIKEAAEDFDYDEAASAAENILEKL